MSVLEFKPPTRIPPSDDAERVPRPPKPRRPYEMLYRRGLNDETITFLGCDRTGAVIVEVRVARDATAVDAMPALESLVRTLDRAKWKPSYG